MSQAPSVRLYLYFARESDRAVILRQGPSKTYRMILWHRESDRFEDGQWVKHKVYPERCHLSPDGQHFMYFMLDGRWNSPSGGAYNAISRPPYWTAVSLFPLGDTWTHGGAFIDAVHYLVPGGSDIIGRDEGLARVQMGEPGKGCTTGIRLMSGARAPIARSVTRELLQEPLPEHKWALVYLFRRVPEQMAETYMTKDGKLFRLEDGEAVLIRDFTDMSFEAIRAPYDWRDGAMPDEGAPWHPLDGHDT
jgi:hypothetical protein